MWKSIRALQVFPEWWRVWRYIVGLSWKCDLPTRTHLMLYFRRRIIVINIFLWRNHVNYYVILYLKRKHVYFIDDFWNVRYKLTWFRHKKMLITMILFPNYKIEWVLKGRSHCHKRLTMYRHTPHHSGKSFRALILLHMNNLWCNLVSTIALSYVKR